MTGNEAVAYGVLLSEPDIIAMYPITPQTPIVNRLAAMAEEGLLKAELVDVESEHTAMATLIGASITGNRVFTASASQGVAYMHEMLHYAAGSRVPVVMAVASRNLGAPWGFSCDHMDVLSQRDTGWLQLYTEDNQEALDTIIQAFKVAEEVLLPTMVVMDGFFTSHTIEPTAIPSLETVRSFLPPFDPPYRLRPGAAESINSVVLPGQFGAHRREMAWAFERALAVAERVSEEWGRLTGRYYPPVEAYRTENAKLVLVTAGSMTGSARDAVDVLRDEGLRVGLVKLRLVRPFATGALARALAGVPVVAVLERTYSPGLGGIFCQEVKSALYGCKHMPRVYGYLLGVGGTNVSPTDVIAVAREVLTGPPANGDTIWVGG